MELKRKIVSRIPMTLLWGIVVPAIGYQISGFSQIVLVDIPGRAAILILGVAGLAILALILERVIPQREVFFCKIGAAHLVIAPNGRKRFHWKLAIDEIDEIRLARKSRFNKELYIFLKNGFVKSFSDKAEALDRLVEYISADERNISVRK